MNVHAIMNEKLPHHVAIVMDGNGRWATAKGMDRLQGHEAGAKAAFEIVRHCRKIGISYVTFYAFSCENWKRPPSEVDGLMRILQSHLHQERKEWLHKGVRLKTIGELERLPNELQVALEQVCDETKDQSRLQVTLALSYGGRDEILRAMTHMKKELKQKKHRAQKIDPDFFSRFLDTAGMPDPDLFIRTGGEKRLSNFLLWQLSYSELYFSDVLWPDFSPHDFDLALEDYQRRQRRFGMTSEQVSSFL